MQKLNILTISGYPPWHPEVGGGDIIAFKLSEALAQMGHNITFLAVADRSLRKDVNWGDFRYVSEGEDLSSISLETDDFDIVHIHNVIGLGFRTYNKMRKGRKSIVGLYAPLAHRFPRSISEIFYGYLCRDADMVMSLSLFSKMNIASAYNVNPEKINVMYAGVDHGFFVTGSTDKNSFERDNCVDHTIDDNISKKPFRLLFSGRLNGKQQKGVDILLNSMPLILKEHNVTLDIAGRGPRLDQYKRQSRSLGIEEHVRFRGFVPHEQMPEKYSKADLFVFPSRRESFGLVLAEAMAAGLTVVSTKVGAIPEVVEDGITGMLVLPDDPEKFAAAVNSILDDPGRMITMGLAGRERVKKYFTWKKVAQSVSEFYQELF